MVAVARSLRRRSLLQPNVGSPPSVVGVNIGKNRTTPFERATEDYIAAFIALAPLGQYVTVNISSPNTPGLRQLHERSALAELLSGLQEVNRRLPAPRPIFLKVSPDETPDQLDDVVRVGYEVGISGFIASNTTLSRVGLQSVLQDETGGLSGRPLIQRARHTIRYLAAATSGDLPIIGVGGVASAVDAYEHIRAGATMVQLYTGLVYQGPGLIRTMKRDLAHLLRRDGFASVHAAVGTER
jgi:dihydroorotate dehydrogenase